MRSRITAAIVMLALSLTLSMVHSVEPAFAERPPETAIPTEEGEIYDWGSGDARECFIALYPLYEAFLEWVPIDCGIVDSIWGVGISSANPIRVWLYTARVEIYKSTGRLRAGADAVAVVNGAKYTVPAGWLASAHELFKWNGSTWTSIGNTGYQYNQHPRSVFGPTRNWGLPGRNAWYYIQGYSYMLTYGGWIGATGSSGSISIPPSGLAPAIPPPPGPPDVKPIPPPPNPTPFGK